MAMWRNTYHDPLEQAIKRQTASTARNAEYNVTALAERVDKLTLLCHALWTLLQEKTDLTEEDLETRVTELDLQDGVQDGKATRTATECPNCGKMISKRHSTCMYCGTQRAGESAFHQI